MRDPKRIKGKGKYDDYVQYIMTDTKADAVIVIVMGGLSGNGMGARADDNTIRLLPEQLRYIAKQLEEKMNGADTKGTTEGSTDAEDAGRRAGSQDS